jgi:hypothetical protein
MAVQTSRSFMAGTAEKDLVHTLIDEKRLKQLNKKRRMNFFIRLFVRAV